MNECGKAVERRVKDLAFTTKYFVGSGIDIGGGDDGLDKYADRFPLITRVLNWDLPQGDANRLPGVVDNTYDFVHSTHCLEHMHNPALALRRWIQVVKPLGYLVVMVPEEDMYEQGVWPSTWNEDHKHSFTVHKPYREHPLKSWSPVSVNITNFCMDVFELAEIIKIEKLHATFDETVTDRVDQTFSGPAECAIEFVLRKRKVG